MFLEKVISFRKLSNANSEIDRAYHNGNDFQDRNQPLFTFKGGKIQFHISNTGRIIFFIKFIQRKYFSKKEIQNLPADVGLEIRISSAGISFE